MGKGWRAKKSALSSRKRQNKWLANWQIIPRKHFYTLLWSERLEKRLISIFRRVLAPNWKFLKAPAPAAPSGWACDGVIVTAVNVKPVAMATLIFSVTTLMQSRSTQRVEIATMTSFPVTDIVINALISLDLTENKLYCLIALDAKTKAVSN